MGFSVQPIESGFGKRAPFIKMPFGGFRTPFLIDKNGTDGTVEFIDRDTIKISAAGDNIITRIDVYFGFIAAANINLEISGLLEEANNGFDSLEIFINNVSYYFNETSDVVGIDGVYKNFSDNKTITLNSEYMSKNSCGALCKISFDTIDQNFNDGVFYQIKFIE